MTFATTQTYNHSSNREQINLAQSPNHAVSSAGWGGLDASKQEELDDGVWRSRVETTKSFSTVTQLTIPCRSPPPGWHRDLRRKLVLLIEFPFRNHHLSPLARFSGWWFRARGGTVWAWVDLQPVAISRDKRYSAPDFTSFHRPDGPRGRRPFHPSTPFLCVCVCVCVCARAVLSNLLPRTAAEENG